MFHANCGILDSPRRCNRNSIALRTAGLVGAQLLLGMIVGYLEGWSMGDATYFTFVTGLTIGYGDLVPARLGTRLISVAIGLSSTLSNYAA